MRTSLQEECSLSLLHSCRVEQTFSFSASTCSAFESSGVPHAAVESPEEEARRVYMTSHHNVAVSIQPASAALTFHT